MNNTTNSNLLLLILAAVQAIGAVFSMLSYFNITSASLSRAVSWVLAVILCIGIAFAVSFRPRGPRLVFQQPEASNPIPKTSTDRPSKPTLRSLQIHRLVTLTVWSMLASFVVIMSTHITGFYLVALAPLWVSAGSFSATRIASGNKTSAIMLGSLLCGVLGTWLGSVGDGDTGTQLGFVWGSMAGGLTTSFFARRDAYMSFPSSLISTLVFFGLTGAILRSSITWLWGHLAGFVRFAFPLLMCESMLILVGYLLWTVLTELRVQIRKNTHRSKRGAPK